MLLNGYKKFIYSGFYHDNQYTRIAQIIKKGKLIKVCRLYKEKLTYPSDPTANVKQLYKFYNNVFSSSEVSCLCSCLDPEKTLTRSIMVGLLKEKEINQTYRFLAEPSLPFNLNDVILEKIIVESENKETLLTIVAVKKEYLFFHQEKLNALHIQPDLVSCIPSAIASIEQLQPQSSLPRLSLYIGSQSSVITMSYNGALISDRTLQVGSDDFLKVITLESNLSENEGEQILSDNSKLEAYLNTSNFTLEQPLNLLKISILRAIASFPNITGKQISEEILTLGNLGKIGLIRASLTKLLPFTLITPTTEKFTNVTGCDLQEYALEIGLGINAAIAKKRINFKKDGFAPPFLLKKVKAGFLTSLCLIFLITLTTFYIRQTLLKRYQNNVNSSFQYLLSNSNLDFFKTSNSTNKLNQYGLKTFEKFNATLIKGQLAQLKKKLKALQAPYPLAPDIPLVSDVLGWIESLSNQINQIEKSPSNIKIEKFRYQLVSHPEIEKPKQLYKVKVDLVFLAVSSKAAREFHELLLSSNQIINTKNKVDWGFYGGKYHSSFILIDKTHYPIANRKRIGR